MTTAVRFKELRLSAVISHLEEQLSGYFAQPRRGAEIMTGSVLRWPRADLYARWNYQLTDEQVDILNGWVVRRRRTMEPLQYITGTEAFRTLHLEVGPGTLVPRPETEIVVERCLDLVASVPSPRVVDIGTGSGAIALSLAVERRDASVWATEVSDAACEWVLRNIGRMNPLNVTFLQGDLLKPLPPELMRTFDLVVSNPPYLSTEEFENTPHEVKDHEPRVALDAGPTGLEISQRLIPEAVEWLKPGGWLVLETSETQWGRLKTLMSGVGLANVEVHPDLTGRVRVAQGQKP